jgi:sulfide:quinone oxidoreductase
VDVVHTSPEKAGEHELIRYDYLINATGPKLNFQATPGLGPDGNSWSVCTAGHAVEAAAALEEVIARLRDGQPQRLVIGMGHGTCTCEGAAFEYALNVEHELRAPGCATWPRSSTSPTSTSSVTSGSVAWSSASAVS